MTILDVVSVDGIGNLPAQPHDGAEGHHVVLKEVIYNLSGSWILNNASVEDFECHVLPDGVDQLTPVAHDGKGLSGVIRTVNGEVHTHAVQRIPGIALHVGLKNGLAVLVH